MSECDGNNTKYVFHLFDLYVAAVNTVKCHFVETHTNGENIIFFPGIYHMRFGISMPLY